MPSWRDHHANRLRPVADRLRDARARLEAAQHEGRSPQELGDLARDVELARLAYHRAKRFGPGVG